MHNYEPDFNLTLYELNFKLDLERQFWTEFENRNLTPPHFKNELNYILIKGSVIAVGNTLNEKEILQQNIKYTIYTRWIWKLQFIWTPPFQMPFQTEVFRSAFVLVIFVKSLTYVVINILICMSRISFDKRESLHL